MKAGDKRLVTQNNEGSFDLDHNIILQKDKKGLLENPKQIKDLFVARFNKVLIGESFPLWQFFIYALLLGFVAYGLSIFFYIKAQNKLGAAKTSAFYAVNPFIGAILSLIIFNDTLAWNFYVALGIMAIGTVFIIIDTIERQIEFFILAGHKC